MARGKKKEESGLVQALRFVSAAQLPIGAPHQTHCRFINNELIAYDGILAIGTPVESEVTVCPHTFKLIAALEKATGSHSISLLDTMQLNVNTNKFRALVPYVRQDDIPYIYADANQYPLTDGFREALNVATTFVTEGSTNVAYAAAFTRDGSIVGTNGHTLIEAWHGDRTPPGLVIPKQFANVLSKINRKIVGFGFNHVDWSSFTVHFEDHSWLRTQLYIGTHLPNFDMILAYTDTALPVEIPSGFFNAVKAVIPFSEHGRVWLGENTILSHPTDEQGATHVCKGVEECGSFIAKYFVGIEPFAKKFDFNGNDTILAFFGETDRLKVRGAFAKSRS